MLQSQAPSKRGFPSVKITIDIDCTPEEARTFFGLPDVQPLQKAMMEHLQAQMEDQFAKMNPEDLMKSWLAPGMESFGKFQQAMWQAATGKKAED
jgi:hypothetical protein